MAETNTNPDNKRSRVKKILAISGIVLLAVTLITVNVYRVAQKDVVQVSTARVTRKLLIEKVPAEGRVTAPDKEVLLSEAAGVVKSVPVRLGDQVKAGQLLMEIYVPRALENLAEAESSLARAEANLTKARSGGKSAELAAAELALREAESTYSLYEDALKRSQALYEQGALSRVDLDKAQADYDNGQAALEKARAEYRRLLDSAGQDLQSLQAAVDAARLHLEAARRQASGQGLICPRDGQVLSVNVEPGDVVSEQTPVLTISSLNKLEIRGEVPETEASKIKAGQKAEITGNAFSGLKYQGKIAQVGLEVVSKSQSQTNDNYLPVIVEIENPGALLPGYSVDMDITTAEEDALVVPVEALVEQDEGNSVWLVKNGESTRVPVQTGISDGLTVQIKSGLELDDQVILNPPADLAEGKRIKAK